MKQLKLRDLEQDQVTRLHKEIAELRLKNENLSKHLIKAMEANNALRVLLTQGANELPGRPSFPHVNSESEKVGNSKNVG